MHNNKLLIFETIESTLTYSRLDSDEYCSATIRIVERQCSYSGASGSYSRVDGIVYRTSSPNISYQEISRKNTIFFGGVFFTVSLKTFTIIITFGVDIWGSNYVYHYRYSYRRNLLLVVKNKDPPFA